MYLKDMLDGVKYKTGAGISDLRVRDVTNDSRTVGEGDLFVAMKGCVFDGRRFINEAVARGAKAIVAEEDFYSHKGIMKILVKDARQALSVIADNFYGHPSRKMKVVGVTGTNGKTTVTYIIENILKAAGEEAGRIGTINYKLKDRILPAGNTTPGPLELQSLLSDMVKEGLGFVAMEVSSHSLDQRRVDSVSFDTAVFTNITHEHLDYHKSMSNYFKTKARIFGKLKKDGVAILNRDDRKVISLKKSIRAKVITYGMEGDADIRARDIELSLLGSGFTVTTPVKSFKINTPLIGIHNVSNILAGIACAAALGISSDAIKKGVESVRAVPGRLETIDLGQPFRVFVDYAHTDDALYNILSALKDIAPRHIITVFGCGGNRDRKKRPRMGKVACGFSDHVIITSDNPRFEEPIQIIREIEKGVKGKFSNYDIVVDRRGAIEKALALASKGDIVVIAGKGHEDHQIVKGKVTPFDDREVVRGILKNRYESTRADKSSKGELIVGRSR